MLTKNEEFRGHGRICERCGRFFHVSISDTETELCPKCQEKVYKELGGDY